MALRKIRIDEDPILRRKSREIEKIDDRIRALNEDMFETMYEADGVGLAAPQIGILKKMMVIDIGEEPLTFINPVIIHKEGESIEEEACLSLPEKAGKVGRPQKLVVEATDIEGNRFQLECEDLLARAVCHEIDHLDGVLFIDRVIK
ncbi:MAG: peptide deformylase [Eubacteriaceae bacterium]